MDTNLNQAGSPDPVGPRDRVVNLTSHSIVVRLDSGQELTIPPSSPVARLDIQRSQPRVLVTEMGELDSAELSYGVVDNLPDAQPGVWLIVSLPVALAVARPDLLVVDDVIRDAGGQVVACRSFGTVAGPGPVRRGAQGPET